MSGDRGDTIVQRIAVPFEYPVVFTRGVFEPDTHVFADVISRTEPGRRHRVVVVIDDGVAASAPVVARLDAYAARHTHRFELAASPEIVRGGEAAKDGLDGVIALWKR